MKIAEKIYGTLVTLCGPALWFGLAVYYIIDIIVHRGNYGLAVLAMIPTVTVFFVFGGLSGYVATMVWRRRRWAIVLSLVGMLLIELTATLYVTTLVYTESVITVGLGIVGLAVCTATLLLAMWLLRQPKTVKSGARTVLTPYFIVLSILSGLIVLLLMPILVASLVLGGGLWSYSTIWSVATVAIMAGMSWVIIGVYKKKWVAVSASRIVIPIMSLPLVMGYSFAAPAIGFVLWALGMAIFFTASDNELKQLRKRGKKDMVRF